MAVLALALMMNIASPPPAQAQQIEKLDVPKLLLLKKLGYSEAQLKQAVTQAGQVGKLQLQPVQVLQLRKAGLSLSFIKWLGLAKPTARPPQPRPTKRPVVAPGVLPWELRLPPVRRADTTSPAARPTPKRTAPVARPPAARQPTARPQARRAEPTARPAPAARPAPRLRVARQPPIRPPARYVPPRYIPPSPRVKQLVFALSTSTSFETRRAAAEQLGKMGSQAMSALPALVKVLQLKTVVGYQATYKLKQAAIWAIGRMGPYAFQAVVYLFAQLRKPLLKAYAIDALDRIMLEASVLHGTKLLGFLAQVLQRARWVELQVLTTRHIGYFGTAAAPLVTLLRRALRVQKPALAAQDVRKYAAIALGNIGAKAGAAVPDLARLFGDYAVKQYAQKALLQIVSQSPANASHLPKILEDPTMPLAARLTALHRMMTTGAIAQMNSPSLLLKAFTPSKANTLQLRQAAAKALGMMGPKALPALPALLSALAIKKKAPTSESFRRQICLTLGKMGPQAKAAIGGLFDRIGDFPLVSHAAQRALDQIIQHPANAWSTLTQALRSNSGLARIYAAKQLMRIKLDPTITATAAQRQQLAALQASTKGYAAFWSWGTYELAADMARRQQLQTAIKILTVAVAMGFDDHLVFVLQPLWKSFRQHPGYAALIKQMRSSPADRHELMWLKRERQNIDHDTKMMIIEQMGRKDTMSTQVHQTKIPMHLTSSPAVLINRMLISRQQKLQRFRILLADISRKNHIMTMSSIRNMGSGRLSVYARQQAQNARIMSMSMAKQRALARKRSVLQRQYKRPAGLSPQKSAPPVIKSLPSAISSARQMASRYAQAAENYARAKQYANAEIMASKAIAQQPQWAKAYYIRSYIRSAQKKLKSALADVDKAIQLEPQSYLYWLERSYTTLLLKRYDETIKSAKRSLALSTTHKYVFIAYSNIGEAHLRRGEFQEAYKYTAQALKLRKYDANIIAYMAYILFRLGRLRAANQWLSKALLYKSEHAFGLYTKACIQAYYGRWGVAIETLRQASTPDQRWRELSDQEPVFAPIKNTPAFHSVTK